MNNRMLGRGNVDGFGDMEFIMVRIIRIGLLRNENKTIVLIFCYYITLNHTDCPLPSGKKVAIY